MTLDIKLWVFDMDGTIVDHNSHFSSTSDILASFAGEEIEELWKKNLEYYLHRPELYPEWFHGNCFSLKGKSAEILDQSYAAIKRVSGFSYFCDNIRERGTRGILTGGPDNFARKFKRDFDLDFTFGNDIHIKNGVFTGTGTLNVSIDGKGDIMERIMQQENVPPEQTAYFGDAFNDIPAWKKVGHPFGINFRDDSCIPYVKEHFQDYHQIIAYLKELEK